MKLLSSPTSPYARKVRIALAEKKIDCELIEASPWAKDTIVPSHNPLGKVPVLLLDDGTALYDSRVIVEYLDNVSPISRLIPDNNRDRSAVRRWEALADGVLDAGLLWRYESLRDKKEQSGAWQGKQLARMRRGMEQLAKEIGAFCHGERYSLADIAVGCCLGWLDFRKPGAVDWRAEYEPVSRHYDKMMERPAFADTVPVAPK
jgi:glutathione S-transferase